jgi:hypothetical protein
MPLKGKNRKMFLRHCCTDSITFFQGVSDQIEKVEIFFRTLFYLIYRPRLVYFVQCDPELHCFITQVFLKKEEPKRFSMETDGVEDWARPPL